MPQNPPLHETVNGLREPRGFGEHSRGLSGEYAHEQGWGLNQEERAKVTLVSQEAEGSVIDNDGARDRGDEPVSQSALPEKSEKRESAPNKPIYVRKAS